MARPVQYRRRAAPICYHQYSARKERRTRFAETSRKSTRCTQTAHSTHTTREKQAGSPPSAHENSCPSTNKLRTQVLGKERQGTRQMKADTRCCNQYQSASLPHRGSGGSSGFFFSDPRCCTPIPSCAEEKASLGGQGFAPFRSKQVQSSSDTGPLVSSDQLCAATGVASAAG